MAERVRVRELTSEEGNQLLRVIRRGSGSVVRWRRAQIVALSRLQDHHLPFSTWSLSKLAEFLVAEGVVDDISHEGLRAVLRDTRASPFK